MSAPALASAGTGFILLMSIIGLDMQIGVLNALFQKMADFSSKDKAFVSGIYLAVLAIGVLFVGFAPLAYSLFIGTIFFAYNYRRGFLT